MKIPFSHTDQRTRGHFPVTTCQPAKTRRPGAAGEAGPQAGEPAEGQQEGGQGQQEPVSGEGRR